jgi:hypothetical protein
MMFVNVSADSEATLHSDIARCHKMSVRNDREIGTVPITLRIKNTLIYGVPTVTGVFRGLNGVSCTEGGPTDSGLNGVSNVQRAVLLTAG